MTVHTTTKSHVLIGAAADSDALIGALHVADRQRLALRVLADRGDGQDQIRAMETLSALAVTELHTVITWTYHCPSYEGWAWSGQVEQ